MLLCHACITYLNGLVSSTLECVRITRLFAWLLFLVAIAVSAIGFFWYAGTSLPYPDPTPELLMNQASELRMARGLLLGGILVSAVAVLWLWKTRPKQR